jgi:hypothetical protein
MTTFILWTAIIAAFLMNLMGSMMLSHEIDALRARVEQTEIDVADLDSDGRIARR